jgi:hypothetical protein
MELIITKCSSPGYWYSECIGMTFVIISSFEVDGELHFRTDGNDSSGCVDAGDCNIVIRGHKFALQVS